MKDHPYTLKKDIKIILGEDEFLETPGAVGFTEDEVKKLVKDLPLSALREVVLQKQNELMRENVFDNTQEDLMPPFAGKTEDQLEDKNPFDKELSGPFQNKSPADEAQEVVDHFMQQGARVSNDDYEWVKSKLEE